METFIWLPSAPATMTKKPLVDVAKFKDYEQRAGSGINNNLQKWSLQFTSEADVDAIEAFLEARGGVESFLFTPPKGVEGVYKCPSWGRTFPTRTEIKSRITAQFEELQE